jgi:hypothetical protein
MIIGLAGDAPALQKPFVSAISSPLEVLNGLLVFLRRGARLEGAEISSLACLRIFLPRI